MILRYCKIALAFASFFFLFLVVFNNLTDYGSNYAFVENVLGMKDTFEGNKGQWRALNSPVIYHLFYWSIILWEAVAMVLLGLGTWKLWIRRGGAAKEFNRAKNLVYAGLTVSMLQWYVAFLTVGAEWFLMWQSQTFNGQDAAHRMFVIMGISLVFIAMKDDELSES